MDLNNKGKDGKKINYSERWQEPHRTHIDKQRVQTSYQGGMQRGGYGMNKGNMQTQDLYFMNQINNPYEMYGEEYYEVDLF
jgi:hypothetical protein